MRPAQPRVSAPEKAGRGLHHGEPGRGVFLRGDRGAALRRGGREPARLRADRPEPEPVFPDRHDRSGRLYEDPERQKRRAEKALSEDFQHRLFRGASAEAEGHGQGLQRGSREERQCHSLVLFPAPDGWGLRRGGEDGGDPGRGPVYRRHAAPASGAD